MQQQDKRFNSRAELILRNLKGKTTLKDSDLTFDLESSGEGFPLISFRFVSILQRRGGVCRSARLLWPELAAVRREIGN